MVLKGLKARVTKLKARAMGMTVEDYRQFQKELKEKRKKEKLKFEKWKIEEKYRRKRKKVKRGLGGGILGDLAQISENISANIEGMSGRGAGPDYASLLGLAPPKRRIRKKRRKKKKKKPKVIIIQ